MRRELRPALMHVRQATTEGWLQSEQIRFRAVVAVNAFLADFADDLVRLLVVLMRPHVIRKSGGQRVERDGLQAVR